MLRHAVVPVALLGILSGCMMIDSISPEVRLGDQVHALNDEVRWGRVDLAAQRVASSHRVEFVERHRAWNGGDVRVADADVTHMDLGLPDGRCASYVTYSWIDERTMELRATSVRQLWRSEGEGFVLVGEEIVGGDESLLPGAPRAGAADEALGDEGTITAGGEHAPPAEEDPVATSDLDAGETQPVATVRRTHRRDAQGMRID